MPTLSRCRVARSFRWCPREFWHRFQWHSRLPLRLQRRSARGLWPSWTFFQRGSPLWMKRQASTYLCTDKTGTLTQNALTVTAVHTMSGFDESHVLGVAALASSEGGQDPVDVAIRAEAAKKAASDLPRLIKFTPFDPGTKMSEATATDPAGGTVRAVKGAYAAVAAPTLSAPDASQTANELEAQGF